MADGEGGEGGEGGEVEVVVVGGGQAGLATAYHLRRRGIGHVVLDAGPAVGASWSDRWDSLRLFTPARFSHLPGLRLPGADGDLPGKDLPGKDTVAAYLRAYAHRFGIAVRTGVRVDSVRADGDRWLVVAGPRRWHAGSVVVATGAHAVPRLPAFAGALDPSIVALHSARYRGPEQLPAGPVLVVGAGNSGAEIALELAAGRPVRLAGRGVGHAPPLGNAGYRALRALGRPGAALAARLPERGADPLGRVRAEDLHRAGVRRFPRVTGVDGGRPVAGRPLDVAAVVWCTGFTPARDFLDEPVRAHRHGVVLDRPGLYLAGVPLQTSMTSHLLGGVGRDAAHVVAHLARHRRR
ncbi:MAG: flavin-containing monooxygenase [Pseudonocardia sp.]